MSKVKFTQVCNITTGKLDANAAEDKGKYPYFTCAPEPLAINTYAFDDDVIVLAGNNASGNFHCQRYKGKFNAYQRTYVITAKQGYDIEYVYYNLKINLQHLKNLAQGSQTKFLTMQILENFEVEDISLPEQREKTSLLVFIDRKIENNKRIIIELEEIARTIYDYWFLQFEFPNEEGKPYKSSGGKMVWNEELGKEIPEGWEVKKIDDFGTLSNGINYDKDLSGNKEYKIVNVRNISSTSLLMDKADLDNIYLDSKLADKFLVGKNDILIARSGIPGAVRILEGDIENTIYCGFIICLGLMSDLYRRYLVYKLKDYENTTVTTSGGTIMQNVSQNTLKAIKFAVPNEKSILLFNDKIDALWSIIQKNNKENRELVSLRDFLIPLLIKGKIQFMD